MILDIVAAFCDKDYECVDFFLQTIEDKVHIPHNVILVDNRENYRNAFINFRDAKVISKGYNTYQFEARRYAAQFLSGDYVWFADIDDEILSIDEYLESVNTDFIVFNYTILNDILTLPISYYNKEDKLGKYKEHVMSMDDFWKIPENEDAWYLVGCTLWNKWFKTSLVRKCMEIVPENQIIVASEDLFYTGLFMEHSENVTFERCPAYIYYEKRAQGGEDNVTVDRFMHITRGYDKVRVLFDKNFKHPERYNNIQFSVAYFLSKMFVINNTEECLDRMKQIFTKEEIINGSKHDWVKNGSSSFKRFVKTVLKKL